MMDRILNQAGFQQILQSRKIAYALTDLNLVIQQVHGQIEILNDDVINWQGLTLFDFFPELLGNQQDLEDILAGKLTNLSLEFVNRETESGTRYLTIEDLPYRNETGEIIGIIHLVQDDTSKGHLEQQVTQNRNQLQLLKDQIEHQNLDLIAANTELRRLGELKSDFISLAAHELRTPLTSINGYIEMLLDGQMGPMADEVDKVLKIIQESGLRLVSLTDELLNAARLEAGRVDLMLKPVDLVNLVNEVAAEYSGEIQSKGQTLDLEFAPDLPPALCDEKWTKQIAANLLSNAAKFTPVDGQIGIRVGLSEQPGFLQLSVSDTGAGIPEQDKMNIFSRWYRSKSAASINAQGSGLGLYITRSLVELNGGEIWFESLPGQGSTFYVKLPAAG